MDKENLLKILMNDDVVDSINKNLDILLTLIPELKDMIGFEHNHPHHHLDVWNHTLLALSISPKNFQIRLALLLHDIGKPHSYQDKDIKHFKGHPKVSSEISFEILKRLKFNDDEISELCYLVEQHDNFITTEEILKDEDLAIKKFKIQFCDALAHNPSKLEKRKQYLIYINEKLSYDSEKEKLLKLIK